MLLGVFVVIDALLRSARGTAADDPVARRAAMARVQASVTGRSAPPQVLLGRYAIEEKIGEGATAAVYRATDTQLRRAVALKVLKSSVSRAQRDVVLREGKAIAALEHANVRAVYSIEREADIDFLVMAFVQGEPASRWIERDPSLTEIVRVFVAAGRGLAAAHAKGIVHRDFKPSNVLIASDSEVFVIDFGFATATRSDEENPGTPGYASVEQRQGGVVGPASDQFSWCVSVWETLFGHRPCAGVETPDDARGERRRIAGVLRRGLSVDPERRWPSMEALIAVVEGAQPPTAGRRWQLGVAGVVVALTGLMGVSGERTEVCPAAMQVEDVWDSARREAVASDAATEAPELRIEAMDRWSEHWSQAFRAACQLPASRRSSVLACLEAQGSYADVLVDQSRGRQLWDDLPSPPRCQTRPDLDSGWTLEALRLHEQISEVSALANTQPDPDPATATRFVDLANRRSDSYLLAHALYVRGRIQAARGRFEAAQRDLERAIAVADEVEKPVLLAAASAELVKILADTSEPPSRVEQVVARAMATLARDAPASFRAQPRYLLQVAQGEYFVQSRKAPEAIAVLEDALSFVEDHWGPQDRRVASVLTVLGLAYGLTNRFDDELQAQTHALEIKERRWGRDHPQTLVVRRNRANALMRLGRDEEANDEYGMLLPALERIHGPESQQVASTWNNLCVLQGRLGRFEDAERSVAEFRRIEIALHGPDHPHVTMSWRTAANLSIRRKRWDEAAERANRALVSIEGQLGTDSGEAHAVRLALGEAELMGGNVAQARRHFGRVVAAADSVPPHHVGVAHLGLGRAGDPGDPQTLFHLEEAKRILEESWPAKAFRADEALAEYRAKTHD